MADVVLNHKAAADGLEFEVVEVDPMDRNKVLTEPFTIQGWTNSPLTAEMEPIMTSTGIGTISPVRITMLHVIKWDLPNQGDNKGWAHGDLVTMRNGNYDYLMYADIDFQTSRGCRES